MTTKHQHSSIEKGARVEASDSPGEDKQTVSPGERWVLIAEKAYSRAQRRGFVGGDPINDWWEAEREVDARYHTALQRVFTKADAERMQEYVKSAFGGYSLGYLGLDALLDRHRAGFEKMAERNRKLLDSTAELTNQQLALFQEAVDGAMQSLQSFAQGKVSTDVFAKQADLSARAIENVLSHLKTITEAVSDTSPPEEKGDGEK